MPQVIIIGGGLGGCSAAHTVIQNGHNVVLIDKNAFLGGNSVKATSGINGAGTNVQKKLNIPDTADKFEEDTIRSATGIKTGPCPPPYALGKVLTHESSSAVTWLNDSFSLGMDAVSRLGGHSFPRTHRNAAGGKFPGMMITYALIQKLEEIAENSKVARIITRARVNELLTDSSGRVVGCKYIKGGKTYEEHGPVVVSTGGYGAGVLFDNTLLKKVRPELGHLPTTNGEHCTGDGIEFSTAIGAGAVDLKDVQVHPTGLVAQNDPDNRIKFLAAGALRGEGGIILNKEGKRFTNDLGTRDYVTTSMWNDKPPFRLVLNSRASGNIAWHCNHYIGRKVMKKFENGYELAKEMGVSPDTLKATFAEYNESARTKKDPYGLKFFAAAPISIDDDFHVAEVTPVVHYTMGGLLINDKAEVLYHNSTRPIPGLWAAGEVAGGVHGRNRLGGSALLEGVVFGRVAGKSVVQYLNSSGISTPVSTDSISAGSTITIKQPNGTIITISVGNDSTVTTSGVGGSPPAPASFDDLINAASHRGAISTDPTGTGGEGTVSRVGETENKGTGKKVYTWEEIRKHNKDTDCWVVVNGQVLDVTDFMQDHPGGKMAIMTFAGKDATEEFNMLHEKTVIQKYAPEVVIGTLESFSPKESTAVVSETKETGKSEYSWEEIRQHNKDTDCWVVVNGQVLDVTDFMKDHPGGKMAIMTFAGKDATEEFNMLHEETVIQKYAPEVVIGILKPGAKL